MPRIPPVVKQVIRHAKKTGENGPLYITFEDDTLAHPLCCADKTEWWYICEATVRRRTRPPENTAFFLRWTVKEYAVTGVATAQKGGVTYCWICTQDLQLVE